MILYFILTLTIFLLAPFHEVLWANCHKASVVIWKILNIRFTSAFCCHFNKPALSNKVCMYQEAIPWVPEVFFSSAARLRTVSSFFVRRAKRPRHTNDHMRDWRYETGEAWQSPRFWCLAALPLNACARALPFLKMRRKREVAHSLECSGIL